MKCPFCDDQESKVVDSRHSEDGLSIRRRRECLQCQRRFTTYETVESLPIVVVTPGEHLNDVAAAIEHEASEAAGAVAKLTKEPKLSFSAITDGGYVGSITFKVADSRTSARAGDAVLRAVAPLTRAGAPEAAGKVLEEARQEAEEAEEASEEAAAKPKPKPKPKPAPKQKQKSSFRKRMARALRIGKEEQS